jgi:hypothetical protein
MSAPMDGPEPCGRCGTQKIGDLKDATFYRDGCDFPHHACYAVLCASCFEATHDLDGWPNDLLPATRARAKQRGAYT